MSLGSGRLQLWLMVLLVGMLPCAYGQANDSGSEQRFKQRIVWSGGEHAWRFAVEIETFAKIRELTRTVGELAKTATNEEKKTLMQKSGEIISDILGDSLNVSETETTFEINLAVMSIKHTVKRGKGKAMRNEE